MISIADIPGSVWLLLVLALVWELVWKAIALWKSARSSHIGWFIAVLFINSVGILPIIYLTWFADNAWLNPHPPVEIIPKRRRPKTAS